MPLTISCEAFTRLASLSQHVEHKEYTWLRSVALHRKNGRLFALATDSCFCAVEFIADQPGEPDEFVLINTDAALIAQCNMEKPFASSLVFTVDAALAYVTAATSFGYVHPVNVGVFPLEKIPLRDWQTWVVPFPKQNNGGIFLNVDRMSALVRSSPSGCVVFPTTYDVTKPLAVRDAVSDNWLGFFVPYDRTEKAHGFEVFPHWVL